MYLPMSKVKDKALFEQNKSYDLSICEINTSNRRIVLSYEEDLNDKISIDEADSASVEKEDKDLENNEVADEEKD